MNYSIQSSYDELTRICDVHCVKDLLFPNTSMESNLLIDWARHRTHRHTGQWMPGLQGRNWWQFAAFCRRWWPLTTIGFLHVNEHILIIWFIQFNFNNKQQRQTTNENEDLTAIGRIWTKTFQFGNTEWKHILSGKFDNLVIVKITLLL